MQDKAYFALKANRYIQYNTEELYYILAVDIDTHKDGGAWLDAELPEPSFTVWTDRGVQFSWILNKPILANIAEHRQYAEDTLYKIGYALGADKHALAYNRIFRNPFKNRSRITDTRVNLSDFKHLETPPKEYLPQKKKSKKHYADVEVPDFWGMIEGDGRNEAMFDRLRLFAYSLNNAGLYREDKLAEQGYKWNYEFKQQLANKELETIIKSIDRYIEKYNRGEIEMKQTRMKLDPEERTEIARKNGKKGGAVTAKKRKAEAWGKILATITQMESFEIKITISDVARRAKSKPDTVRALMKENGWEEVSRKEGWKAKKKIISLVEKNEDLQNIFATIK